jgi:glycosyltransferase involved in cell wall biosynthesis
MKVGVYAIALNEVKHLERWYDSVRQADFVIIGDTGSTDGTVEKAKTLGIITVPITVLPWRFDDARNAVLAHMPKDLDFCISLDLDEIIQGEWRKAFQDLGTEITRLQYRFAHRVSANGEVLAESIAEKIHSRFGYRWVNAVHEQLTPYSIEEIRQKVDLTVLHLPDVTKSRSQYLELMALAVVEQPSNSQMQFWYARELYYHNQNSHAKEKFLFFLNEFPDAWPPERAWAYLFLAKIDPPKALEYLFSATQIAPYLREPWLDLADYYRLSGDWIESLLAAKRAERITDVPKIYLVNSENYSGPRCLDLIALASHFLKFHTVACDYGAKALSLRPSDERLAKNLEVYERSKSSLGDLR